MSDLLTEDATAEVANLLPGQKVFRLLSTSFAGSLIRVTILRNDEDLTGDGTPDQVNLKVEGAVVDLNNNVLLTPGGRPMVAPGKVDSLALSALAEGEADIVVFHAQLSDDCIHRMVRMATALQIYDNIPSVTT